MVLICFFLSLLVESDDKVRRSVCPHLQSWAGVLETLPPKNSSHAPTKLQRGVATQPRGLGSRHGFDFRTKSASASRRRDIPFSISVPIQSRFILRNCCAMPA